MPRSLQFLILTVLAGCGGGLGERSVAPINGRLPLPAGARSVRIELGDGRVDVLTGAGKGGRPADGGERVIAFEGVVRRAADSPQGLAALEAAGTELVFEPDPNEEGAFRLRGPHRPAGSSEGILAVELRLEMPADLALSIDVAGSGDLVVEDRKAATSLRTGRGDVRLMACSGAGSIHTGYGTIIVYDHRGDLDVETGSGDMQVFVRQPDRRIRLVDGQGNIQCIVPVDTGFRVDARTQTGKMANGFGLPIEHPSAYSATMVGQRGDGRTEIVLRTGSGHLSLSHKTFD